MIKYIDTDRLLELIEAHHYKLISKDGSTDYGMFTVGIKQAIDEVPTADIKEVDYGRWIIDNIVKHQQTEIERLNKRVSDQKHALLEQQAYTAKLQDTIETKCDDCNNIRLTRPEYWKAIKIAKAEAYKEFAEKAAIALTSAYSSEYAHWIDVTLNNLLKELVGDNK